MKPNDYADIEVPGELEKDFEKEIVVSNDTESDYFYRITVKAHVRIRKDNLTQVQRSIMHVYPQMKIEKWFFMTILLVTMPVKIS